VTPTYLSVGRSPTTTSPRRYGALLGSAESDDMVVSRGW